MSVLRPTLSPDSFESFMINTAYSATAGAVIAGRTNITTSLNGALIGGVTYAVVTGAIGSRTTPPLTVDPLMTPAIPVRPKLGSTIGSLLDQELQDAWKEGPALKVNPIRPRLGGTVSREPKHQILPRDV